MSNGTEKVNENWSLHSAMPGISLSDLVGMVQRRLGLLLICIVTCLALSLGYFLLATQKYESTAQILVMKKDSNLAGARRGE